MWSCKIQNIEKKAGRVIVILEYSNSADETKGFSETHQLTNDPGQKWLERESARRIALIDSVESWADQFTVGQEITPDSTPTAEETAQNEYSELVKKAQEYELAKKLVDLGIATAAEVDLSGKLTDAQAKVKK